MARLSVIGEYVGPGEKYTCETLAKELPDDWVLIANKSLPDSNRSDVDLVAISPSTIFVIEEKSWGPNIEAAAVIWRTSGGERRDPLDLVARKSKTLATLLGDKINGYKGKVGSSRPVRPVLILSHKKLNLKVSKFLNKDDLILQLSDSLATKALIAESNSRPNIPPIVRSEIITFLEGCKFSDRKILRIGDYEVIQELEPVGRSKTFYARNSQWKDIYLRCHPLHGWGPNLDPRHAVEREVRTLQLLEAGGKKYRALPIFTDEVHQWIVTPFRLNSNEDTLDDLEDKRRARDAGLPKQASVEKITRAAFTELQSVHQMGVIHRGICPARIRIGPQNTVTFSDYFLARIDKGLTLPFESFSEDKSKAFRAPECLESLHSAIRASDVYSLGLSLTAWAVGQKTADFSSEKASSGISSLGEIGKFLSKTLEPDPSRRIDLDSAVQLLSGIAENLHVEVANSKSEVPKEVEQIWEDNSLIQGRYKLTNSLGKGSFAQSWLAVDQKTGEQRVLKKFISVEASNVALNEFKTLSKINHPNCSRTWDIFEEPRPGFLVNEYIQGETLFDWTSSSLASANGLKKIAIDILSALKCVHENNLVHRDVNPHNIIVRKDGSACLIDFGLACVAGKPGLVTTPGYSPPEIENGKAFSFSGDLFGLGTTLNECLERVGYGSSDSQLDELADWMRNQKTESRPQSADDVLQKLATQTNLPNETNTTKHNPPTTSQSSTQKEVKTQTAPAIPATNTQPKQRKQNTNQKIAAHKLATQTNLPNTTNTTKHDPSTTAQSSTQKEVKTQTSPTITVTNDKPQINKQKVTRFSYGFVALAVLLIGATMLLLSRKTDSSNQNSPLSSQTPATTIFLTPTTSNLQGSSESSPQKDTQTSISATTLATSINDISQAKIFGNFTPSTISLPSTGSPNQLVVWRGKYQDSLVTKLRNLQGYLCPSNLVQPSLATCIIFPINFDQSNSSFFGEFRITQNLSEGTWLFYLSESGFDRFVPIKGTLTVKPTPAKSVPVTTTPTPTSLKVPATTTPTPTSLNAPSTTLSPVPIEPLDCTPSIQTFGVSPNESWAQDQADFGVGAVEWSWSGNECLSPNQMHLQIVCASKWNSNIPIQGALEYTTFVRWQNRNYQSDDSNGPYWGFGKNTSNNLLYLFTGKDLEGFLKTNGDCRARTILSPNYLTDLIDYPSLLEGTSEDQYDYKNSSVSLWVSSPPVRACSDWRRPSGSRWTFTQATGKFYCDLPGGTLQISEVVSCPTRQGNYGCKAMLANKQ